MSHDDSLTIATIDFHAAWGDKARNLDSMEHWVEQAVGQGADMVLFPETALTGYNVDDGGIAMQQDNAETADGPAATRIATLARRHGIHIAFGLPERDAETGILYNSAIVAGPDGPIGCYRKLHPAGDEARWAAKGDDILLFETRWGLVGLGICYDTYHFPELVRAYCAMGVRLYLNPTAVPQVAGWQDYYLTQLKARVIENGCVIASANLVGEDRNITFPGHSLIIGPDETNVLATRHHAAPVDAAEGMRIATVDLFTVDAVRTRLPVFTNNRLTGEPDWRPDICERLLKRVRGHASKGKIIARTG